jgi:beta-phosphoglucomutase
MKHQIQAFIFDLDGVIVDTAIYHFQSWKQLAARHHFEIPDSLAEDLKGLGRMESLDKVLVYRDAETSSEEKIEMARDKNDMYLENISHISHGDTLPGVDTFLSQAKADGLKLAIGSGSKNARPILERLGITDMFDAICDGTNISRSKPDPEIFQCACKSLKVDPQNAVVFEDATSGIQAARSCGTLTVGIGDPGILGDAHIVMPSLNNVSPADILKQLAEVQ